MFLLVNLLLGEIPETLGLLLFGIALIIVTVGLRWVLSNHEKSEMTEESLEKLSGKN